jgi:hypothetical protein
MSEVIKLKKVPEPVMHNGRAKLAGGWSTAGVGAWLISKQIDDMIALGEVAVFGYGRDSASNRQGVKSNIAALRRWLADRGEFLILQQGYRQRVEGLKVCNFADENDRHAAESQLRRLVERGEVTMAEAARWEKQLYLPGMEIGK